MLYAGPLGAVSRTREGWSSGTFPDGRFRCTALEDEAPTDADEDWEDEEAWEDEEETAEEEEL